MDIIKSIEHEQMKNKIPVLNVGDTVKVHVRVKEGNRERIQVFEGIIIKVQHGGSNKTFTVRKNSYGVGVEKTFLIHSPTVEKIEVVRVGKVRRAKLFYLRERLGKSAKTREKVGARIETKEITLKEELAEEVAPIEEDVKQEEIPVAEEVAPVEEVKEEIKEEAAPAEEIKEEAKEEAAPAEEVKEEAAPAEEVKEEVKEETAPAEEVKEEVAPAEEAKEATNKEEEPKEEPKAE